MAVNQSGNTTATPPSGNAPGTVFQEPMYTPGATGASQGGDSGSFLNMLQHYGVGNAATEGVRKYLEDIKDQFEASNVKIDIVAKSTPMNGIYEFNFGNATFLLGFTEMLNPAPTSGDQQIRKARADHLTYAVREILNRNGNRRLVVGSSLVAPNDYTRASVMANWIQTSLRLAETPIDEKTNFNSIFKNRNVVIDTSIDSVREAMNKFYPLSSQPRYDYGFVIHMRNPAAQDREIVANPRDSMMDDLIPMAVVVAYTDFHEMAPNAQQVIRYQPRSVITAITPILPHPALAVMAMANCYEQFVRVGLWKTQFMNMGPKPGGGEHENIGNLVGQPLADIQQLEASIAYNCEQPIIEFSVAEGLPWVSMMYDFVSGIGGASSTAQLLADLFGRNVNVPAITRNKITELIGTYKGQNGADIDTRTVSYLSVVSKVGATGQHDNTYRNLMRIDSNNPGFKIPIIESVVGPIVDVRYTDNRITPDPAYMTLLSELVADSGVKIHQFRQHMNVNWMSPEWMHGIGNAMAAIPSIVARAGWSPSGVNYGATYGR